MRINGFDAKELWIRGCETDQYQCYKPDIYCPPNVNGIPKCHIIGGNLLRNGDYWNVHGFNDLDMNGYIGSCFGGCGTGYTMHCGYGNYSTSSCLIAYDHWGCDTSGDTLCNDPPTRAPSTSPTINSTLFPTSMLIHQPSSMPTNNPTMDPSSHPTIYPSMMPSQDPSLNPATINATHTPTETPTPAPTDTPTPTPINNPTMDLSSIHHHQITYPR